MDSIFEFFTFQRVLKDKTFYKNIKIIPPGTILEYQNKKISFIPYWKMKFIENRKKSEKHYVNELIEILKKSMTIRTKKENNLGLLLSGGLDSRVFPATIKDKKTIAFTYADYKNLEFEIARKISKIKNYEHIFLKINLDDYIDLLDNSVEVGDGMYSLVHFPTLFFSNKIKEKCNVLFEFWLLDVLFRASAVPYNEFKIFGKTIPFPSPIKIAKNESIGNILIKAKYSLYKSNPKQLFTNQHSSNFNKALENSISNNLKKMVEVKNPYNKIDYFFLEYISKFPSFPTMLAIRQYMNERNIVCDKNLLDFYLRLPPKLRIKGNIWKKALKKIDSKIIGIPYSNTGLSPFIPNFLEFIMILSQTFIKRYFHSKKYGLNFAKLFKENRKFKKIVEETINDPECLNPKIFNISRIREMFKEHLLGKEDYAGFLFLLLTFGKWHKKYGPYNFLD
ncbi:hypothetical protein K8R62_04330, partial [bacterium]|nr:hypothetical protein [bacterium]